MSSYSRVIIFIFLCIVNIYALEKTNIKDTSKEDLFLLMAIDTEINKDYEQSAILYETIFEKTKKYEYLKKAIVMYSLKNNYKKILELSKKNYQKFPKYKEILMQEYVVSLMVLKKYEDALSVAKDMLSLFNNSKNYAIVGDVYYKLKSYNHAVTYYESSYASAQKVATLLPLVDILYSYLDKKSKAISYLETYYRQKGCDAKVCVRLMRYYQQSQNIDGLISILETLYAKYKTTYTKKQLSQIESLLTQYLEKKDINKAIKFLEENHLNNQRLLGLYEKTGNKTKALNLIRKEYKKTKNRSLLGQIAMLEFELAKDKKRVLKHVIANFELALEVDDNPSYQNYFGYLLIDYEININKGLSLVKSALEQHPTNLAYMDSVAWGYYKTNQCTKALKYMKKVVKGIGLNNEETILHWDKINNCKKGNR